MLLNMQVKSFFVMLRGYFMGCVYQTMSPRLSGPAVPFGLKLKMSLNACCGVREHQFLFLDVDLSVK